MTPVWRHGGLRRQRFAFLETHANRTELFQQLCALRQKAFTIGVNSQNFQLSISHRLSRHATLSLGNYGRPLWIEPGISHSAADDCLRPRHHLRPDYDFFNNRTITVGTQASVAMQRSTRLSISLGERRVSDTAAVQRSMGRPGTARVATSKPV